LEWALSDDIRPSSALQACVCGLGAASPPPIPTPSSTVKSSCAHSRTSDQEIQPPAELRQCRRLAWSLGDTYVPLALVYVDTASITSLVLAKLLPCARDGAFIYRVPWTSVSYKQVVVARTCTVSARVWPFLPAISHLLFADDSIFFTRGDAKNLQALNEVLHTYSEGLGQRINFKKSSVFFGDHCPEHIKDRIMTCLNVRCVAIQTNYLGMPSWVGRSPTNTFNFLPDRM